MRIVNMKIALGSERTYL